MIYHIATSFLKHFRVSISLNFYWSPLLEALLEMKKIKNTKDITKCSQYYIMITVIDKFQQFNLFIFKLLFYVVGYMSIKSIVKFVIFLASLFKKSINFFLKYYIFIKFWAYYKGK